MGGSEILSPSESVKIASFVLFKMLGEGGGGGSEILSPLEFGVNSRFCSV